MEQLLELVRPVLERAKRVILSPRDALIAVKSEDMTLASGVKDYLAILAAFPAIARFIGIALVGLPLIGRSPFFRSLFHSAVWYALSVIVIIVMGKIINGLAPTFSAMKDDMNAFKLAAYSFTPVLAAGVFNLIPSLGILAVLGSLYGIYILYIGLPIMMEVPQEKAMAYTVVTLIAGFVVWIVAGVIGAAIAWGGDGAPGRLF
ncbi:YIP1 family protein [bacterium]|nr:YIP1 family protein [bacterium]